MLTTWNIRILKMKTGLEWVDRLKFCSLSTVDAQVWEGKNTHKKMDGVNFNIAFQE